MEVLPPLQEEDTIDATARHAKESLPVFRDSKAFSDEAIKNIRAAFCQADKLNASSYYPLVKEVNAALNIVVKDFADQAPPTKSAIPDTAAAERAAVEVAANGAAEGSGSGGSSSSVEDIGAAVTVVPINTDVVMTSYDLYKVGNNVI